MRFCRPNDESWKMCSLKYFHDSNMNLRYLTFKDGEYFMDFVVSSYVCDSHMNSTLTSSARFAINEEDYDKLKENTGRVEGLIEFYFTDTSQATKFQTAYENNVIKWNKG